MSAAPRRLRTRLHLTPDGCRRADAYLVPVAAPGGLLDLLGRTAGVDARALLALAEASGRGYAVAPAGSGSGLDGAYVGVIQIPDRGDNALAELRLRALAAADAIPDPARVIAVDAGAAHDPRSFHLLCEGVALGRRGLDVHTGDSRLEAIEGRAESALQPALKAAAITAAAINWGRELVDAPSDVLTPEVFAERAHAMAAAARIAARGWSAEEVVGERLAGLLTVARGAVSAPTLVDLDYAGADPKTPSVVLIGKAITFDSGGLQAKTTRMEWNKADMAGGAAVLAALWAVATLGIPANVRALIPCTENLGGPEACRPGDIIRHRDGRTTEIRNTDGEGRLVLADLLAYAAESRPKAVIDVGTLTNPFGERVWGYASNDPHLASSIERASVDAGEPAWRVPLHRGYLDQLASPVADLANYPPVPSAAADNSAVRAITAALFLEPFAGRTSWAHLDIAGTAFHLEPTAGWPAGATGCSTGTLIRLVESLARST